MTEVTNRSSSTLVCWDRSTLLSHPFCTEDMPFLHEDTSHVNSRNQ